MNPRLLAGRSGRALRALAVLVPALLCACSGDGDKKNARSERPVPVTVAKAEKKSLPLAVKAVGNVEPLATVAVKPQVGGAIVAQAVRDGADVKEGEVLFRIDPRPFELAIRVSQSQLERDRALLVKAEEDLKRYSKLKAKDVVAQDQFDQTYSQAKSLEGTIKLNEANLERSKLDLDYATIRAPIAGRVGSVLVNLGNVIKANDDRTLCVINQIEPLYVSFSVPEQYLPEIMARQRQGQLSVEAAVAGEESRPAVGKLASVDNTVDTKTGTIRLKALYPNADRRLWPGQFVRVMLMLSTLEGVVSIPTQAVMDGLNGPYVYVLSGDGTAESRAVTPGPIVDGVTVVKAGIAPGETVVVDGQIRLAPGVKAEIKAEREASK